MKPKWASQEFEDTRIDLDAYAEKGLIRIEDVEPLAVKAFHDKFDLSHGASLHAGETETLALFHRLAQDWLVCSSDKAVFRTLGVLGNPEQGISLEELLARLGLGRQLEWKYSRQFRRKYTALGQADSIRGSGLIGP